MRNRKGGFNVLFFGIHAKKYTRSWVVFFLMLSKSTQYILLMIFGQFLDSPPIFGEFSSFRRFHNNFSNFLNFKHSLSVQL